MKPYEEVRPSSWLPLDSPKFGVAIYNFDEPGHYRLPLVLGETVKIVEECGGWYRGYAVKNKNIQGIFPASYIHLKDWNETSRDRDSIQSTEYPLVQEMTSVLREWGVKCKHLYLIRNLELFNTTRQHMNDLMDSRRQILSGTLPVDRIKQIKQKVTATIDNVNRSLDLDLVVRDANGNILDPDVTGVIELFRRHDSTRTRIIDEENKTSFPEVRFYSNPIHSLYINIKNVVCNIGDDADVFVTLYEPSGPNGREAQFISEHFLVSWDKQGLPKDLEKLHNMCCLFTDLGSKEFEREKIYVVCQIVRVGRLDLKDEVSKKKKLTQDLRRPFGVAVLDITDFIQRKVDIDEDKEQFLPLLTVENQEYFHNWINKAITKHQENPTKGTGQGIWISVRLLRGDKDQVAHEHPVLINKKTAIARKQGFPEVIMPGDVRNDMFISIISGKFDKGEKTANKNVEVIMRVCDDQGKILKSVISLGAGEPLLSEYRSCIYRHSLSPEWQETVKLVIPIEKFYSSHLIFLFKHRSSKEDKDRSQKITNFAYVRLMNNDGTTLLDGNHDLVVYKCDTKEIKDTSYFKLPSLKSQLHHNPVGKGQTLTVGRLTLSLKESFQISSLLCSTKLTQNVDLLGLLKWKSQPDNLKIILPQVTNVKGEEIVKFLQDIFDALFAILMENPNKYGKLVFDDLVFVINLLADKKYSHFRPVLDTYIADLFSAAKAHDTLISVMTAYIIPISSNRESRLDVVKLDFLFKTMKALEYIVKLIVRSRLLYERTSSEKNWENFRKDLDFLFQALVAMMQDCRSETLKVQGQTLKNIPSIFGHILKVYDPISLGHFARDLIMSIPIGRLNSQKLTCIHDMVKSELFENEASRTILLPMLTNELRPHLQSESESEMNICVDIISDLLVTLKRTDVGPTFDNIHHIAIELLQDILKIVIRIKRELPHAEFLITLFMHFRDLVSNSIYPRDWITMIMVQNKVIVKALDYFSGALELNFLANDSFKDQLWTNFFELSVSFITQGPLNLESFTESKRNKILSKYGDMRKSVALKIRDMWQKLGARKTSFIPKLVGPFLEMTLIPEIEIRKDTIPIFFDMIICENNAKGGFRGIENEIIRKLDIILETGRGDEDYKVLFGQILSNLFSVNPKLSRDGRRFVETITTLLEKLLDYRAVSSDDSIDNRMSCIVNLLNFYKEIKTDEMYIRYLYKLHELHVSVENYTEAAFTLLLHAEVLKWSDEPTSIDDHRKFKASTQRLLKEKLFREIIDLFDKGKAWEEAIKYCKELADQYEKETFQYMELSEVLIQEARFFDKIVKTLRAESEYFRVGFYGQGFPSFLRNKEFIYRGKDYDKVGDFTVRIQNNFPTAQLMTKLTPPGDDIKNSNEQHLQINLVDPVPIERRKYQGKVISEQITQYYERNEVNQFKYDRPFHKGQKKKNNEFATLWLERTCLQTKYRFPGRLRWFEVIHVSRYEISPVNVALETMQSKNQELKTIISRYKKNPQQNINPMSMALNGVIDAAVMGGIANYKTFLSEDFLKEHPNSKHCVDQLKSLITDQVEILRDGMSVHKDLVTDALKPFHANLEKRFSDMVSQVPKQPRPKHTNKHSSMRDRTMNRRSMPVRSSTVVGNRSTVIIGQGLGPIPDELPPNLPEKHHSPEKAPPLPKRSERDRASHVVQNSPIVPRPDDVDQPPPKPERKSTMSRPADLDLSGTLQRTRSVMTSSTEKEEAVPPRPPKTPKKT